MTPATTDLVHHFAEAAANARYEDLPVGAIDAAKKSIIDTLGVILAASGMEPAVRSVVEMVRETGGTPESSVIGFGYRAPAIMAAFANGAMAHSLDFDDQTPWGQHTSSSIVPAALAIAEREGDVSGQDMVTAVAVGQDIFARLRRHVGWRKDWNLSQVVGVFAATAATGRLMRFSHRQIANALGIASMQSSGIMEVVSGTGSDLRGMYAGFSAKGAVVASLLAEKGISGVDALFEGKDGFFRTYFNGVYDREKMLDGLGVEYQGSGTLYKQWPAVGTAHSHIHATIELVTKFNLNIAEIDEIRVAVGDYHKLMCMPLETRRAPTTLVDARFSLPFLVALAAVHRRMSASDFTERALKDPAVLAAARKVVPFDDPALDWKMELPPGRVELVTRDGRRLEQLGTRVPGSAERPLTLDEIIRKFGECAALAATPISADRIGMVQKMGRDLEYLVNVADLLRPIRTSEPDISSMNL